MENRLPFALRYNIIEQKFYVSKLNSFPYIEEGIYYPTSWQVKYLSISGNRLPLFRYNYSSNIFEWDYKNDKLITHSFKTRLIDTIKPMSSPSRYHFSNVECIYSYTHYDKYRGLYFSEFYFSEDFYDQTGGLYNVIIANKDFEYLGELYCYKSWPWRFIKSHILDIYTANDSTIRIDYLELIKTNRSFEKYIDSCKNDLRERKEKTEAFRKSFSKEENPVVEFLKSQKTVAEQDYTVITVYPTGGCIGCNEFVLGFISENQSILGDSPFYFVITDNNMKNITDAIEKYKLKDFKKMIIDSTGTIKKLTIAKGLLNPRLTIVRSNKVYIDEIYESFETETTLMPSFLSSLGLCFSE